MRVINACRAELIINKQTSCLFAVLGSVGCLLPSVVEIILLLCICWHLCDLRLYRDETYSGCVFCISAPLGAHLSVCAYCMSVTLGVMYTCAVPYKQVLIKLLLQCMSHILSQTECDWYS